MGTTPNHALPYPEASDSSQTWLHWQALAEALDALLGPGGMVQSGTVEATGAGSEGGSSDLPTVTFPVPFAAPPRVIQLTGMDSRFICSVNASIPPTAAGFDGFVRHIPGLLGSGATFTVMWTAWA
jgi:hypothetical protein